MIIRKTTTLAVISVLAISALAALGTGHYTAPAPTKDQIWGSPLSGLSGAPNVHLSWPEERPFYNIPAITPLSESEILLVDFQDAYRVNIDTGNAVKLTLSTGTPTDQFQPAGIYFDRVSGIVAIPNYLKNNVMRFRLDGNTLIQVETIKDDHLKSPEGVWIDGDSQIMVVANFDGHSAAAYDLSGEMARFLWEQKVPYAHGVTTYNGRAYLTDLLDRKIHEFDLKTGKKLREAGQLGWNTMNGDMLWPTSIAADGKGSLLLSDAETGFLTIVDAETLKPTWTGGGNGIGKRHLLQPYAAIVAGDQFIAVSTKQEKLVIGDYPSMNVTKTVSRIRDDRLSDFRLGEGAWSGYRWFGGPTVRLFGIDYQIESVTLVPVVPDQGPVLLLNGTTLGGYSATKQLTASTKGEYSLLASPYTSDWSIVTRTIGDRTYATRNLMGEHGCWAIESKLDCPSGSVTISSFAPRVDAFAEQIEGSRCESGVIPYRTFVRSLRSLFAGHMFSEQDPDKAFETLMLSSGGEGILKAARSVIDCNSDGSALQKAVEAFSHTTLALRFDAINLALLLAPQPITFSGVMESSAAH